MSEKEKLFSFISGYMEGFDGLPDGAHYAMHESAVNAFNDEFGTSYDWFYIQVEYFEWRTKEKGLAAIN